MTLQTRFRFPPGRLLALLAPLALAAALLAIPADETRADSGHPGDFPLHCAAGIDGDLAAVVHLLGSAHRINVNARDISSSFYSCGGGRQYGDRYYTPLHWAAHYGRAAIAATLIAAGAEVNAKENVDRTPLHEAARNVHAAVVATLIAAGAEVNAKDHIGWTPLHLAARNGHAAVVATLIAAGAEVNATNNLGGTPLDIARQAKEWDVVALLELSGGGAGADAVAQEESESTPEFIQSLWTRAEQGDAKAQYSLGVAYRKGDGVPQDYAKAAKWYRHAAEQGHAEAQYNLGVMYAEGRGVAQDYSEAVKWTRLAAEQGIAEAQYNLGVAYATAAGVPQDSAEAVKWVRRAAEQGYAEAQLLLGVAYYKGEGVPQDSAEAVKWYRRAAEQGYAAAQYGLGLAYDEGEGVAQDDAEAAKWWRRSAEQRYAEAQYNLGVMLYQGKGVPQDSAGAVKWLRRAAEQGHAEAQYNLARAYYKGEGVPQNYAEAAKWLRRAAEQGDAEAQDGLGVMYGKGQGVPQNDAEKVKWYRRAAEQGHANAQFGLGASYFNGNKGVPQSDWEAYVWFSLAAANGKKAAEWGRDRAAEKLSPAELSSAQKEAVRRQDQIRRKKENANAAELSNSRPSFSPNEAESVFNRAWRSVVVVFAGDTQGGGVIVGGANQVATNCHVVDESPNDIRVYKGAERRAVRDAPYSAEIVSGDRERDVCLLSVPGLWGIAAGVRPAGALAVGEAVYAVGAPQGFDFSISDGIVSQLRTLAGERAPLIQTSAAISPGSSGGGLFDSEGRLVGLTTWKIREGENLNFAVPADWALELQ